MLRGGWCVGGVLDGVWRAGVWVVVVVVLVGVLGDRVADDAVKQVVGDGFYHGGWRWWVKEGYIVVGVMRAGVGSGRDFGWIFGIDVLVQNGDHRGGADEADGLGGDHIIDCGGVGAEARGKGACRSCLCCPVGVGWRRWV